MAYKRPVREYKKIVAPKASEVIRRLQEIIAEHGDLPVYSYNDWNDFPAAYIAVWGPDYEEDGEDSDSYCPRRIVIKGLMGSHRNKDGWEEE